MQTDTEQLKINSYYETTKGIDTNTDLSEASQNRREKQGNLPCQPCRLTAREIKMNSPEIDKKIHKSEETEALVLKLSLGSEPSAQSLIAFDHVILEFWKTDKVFHFCCRLSVGRIRLRIRPHNKAGKFGHPINHPLHLHYVYYYNFPSALSL